MLKYRGVGQVLLARSWRWWLPLFIGITFLSVSLRFGGPAYQQDEIGYLVNAAFFAGYVVDGYSSYHAGYSLFLAPLFAFLGDPDDVWKGVLVVNALFWVGTFYLLTQLLEDLLPAATSKRRLLAIAVAATYPAWVVMAGYAFSQSAFAFFYVAAVLSLLRWRPDKPASILMHSGLVGFLFWIHPTAWGVVLASVASVGLASWTVHRYRSLGLHLMVVLVLAFGYIGGLQPFMMNEMTPEGYGPRGHYPSVATVIAAAANARFWVDWIIVIVGQLSYLAIATFGGVVFGILYLVKTAASLVTFSRPDAEDAVRRSAIVSTFLVGSLLGVMMITATSLASQARGPAFLDEWFYGRYAEGVVLPLFAIGLTIAKRQGFAIGATVAAAVVGVGLLIQSLAGSNASLNLVNIQGFWPHAVFPQSPVVFWFLLGAASLAVSLALVAPIGALPVMVAYLLAIQTQLEWHGNILAGYSRPTAIIDFVRETFPKGECVGFDPYLPDGAGGQMAERIRLYSFYLFDYSYRRMSPSQWMRGCDGPLFTYDRKPFRGGEAVALVGRELDTGLFVWVKGDDVLTTPSAAVVGRGGVSWRYQSGNTDRCLVVGCFGMPAAELKRFSQVGSSEGDLLSTDGRAGYLFFGPYVQLAKGGYELQLEGQFDDMGGAVLDVVSGGGAVVHAREALHGPSVGDVGWLELAFDLVGDVNDLEVRLHVAESTELKVRSYRVGLRSESRGL